MRPIWNGHITFGLISIPVALHSAVEASERVSFRMLHRKDRAPIVYKKFCSKEDKEVPNDEIVKGYELDDDEYTLVEKEDIEKAEKEAGGSDDMEVLQFVDFGAVNPLTFDHPYYISPRKGGEKAYGVLRDALLEAKQVGIIRFRLRKKPTLGALLPGPKAIALESLRPFEELRDPSRVGVPAHTRKSAEVKMARMLIDQMSGQGWDPAEHPNEYRKSLKKLLASKKRFALEEKAEGQGKERAAENVVDLMEALKKSLGQPRREPRRAAGRRRAGAA
jgi:DNA end-binding protein Ku